ncbi:MAG: DUF1738 domain-containing protein [Flavipsychrobacter sp.]|nr:DUF1738 domain-containing protein [Flavipsychrobacter sp.]
MNIEQNIKAKTDIYKSITDKIISLLEEVNVKDWQAPFADLAAQGIPYNPVTGNYYQGVNIPFLWFYQQEKAFRSNQWASFKQWQSKGAKVRKNERGSQVVFYKTLLKSEENEQGEEETSKIPMLRLYTVFNASQVDGYEHDENPAPNANSLVTPVEAIDKFCANTGADIRDNGRNQAYYNPTGDYIQLPDPIFFIPTERSTATEGYVSTLFHELVHWSGAPHRLNRDKAKNGAERQKYAQEELVAELGSAFLCAQFNIAQAPHNHAAYIKSWLAALRNDTKFIFRASAEAARAVEYLNSLQPE